MPEFEWGSWGAPERAEGVRGRRGVRAEERAGFCGAAPEGAGGCRRANGAGPEEAGGFRAESEEVRAGAGACREGAEGVREARGAASDGAAVRGEGRRAASEGAAVRGEGRGAEPEGRGAAPERCAAGPEERAAGPEERAAGLGETGAEMAFFPRVLFGGALYYLLELLWRGRSHPSMVLLGGLCFWGLGRVGRLRLSLPLRALLGAALVTCAEFFSGLLLNLALCWDVWDYSGQPGNLLGQVCLLYAALWVPLSGAGILLSGVLDRVCRRQAALRRSRRRAGGR